MIVQELLFKNHFTESFYLCMFYFLKNYLKILYIKPVFRIEIMNYFDISIKEESSTN